MTAARRRKTRQSPAAGPQTDWRRRPGRAGSPDKTPPLAALSRRELVSLVEVLRQSAADGAGTTAVDPAEQKAPPAPTSLVIDGSVRSGQVVEFLGGDVTVMGSVGSGAEIVAGGSIHVYGALRGRAMAGMNGDRCARIMCRNMQAELLCIDGFYHVADNLDSGMIGRPIHARLDGLRMVLSPLE